MRINRIHAENFLGLRHTELEMGAPVTLVAGPNGAGKSSLRDALRFAMLGESGRVKLKKEYGQLVSEGAKEGGVMVEVAEADEVGSFSMGLPKGEYFVEGAINPPELLPYVIDADRFPALDEKQRRQILFEVTGVKPSQEEAHKRLAERSIEEERIQQVLPMLRSGFEAAHKEADNKAKEERGAWKGVTGENYGAKKAEGWKPEAVEAPDPDSLEAAQNKVSDLEARQAEAQRIRGAQEERARRRQELESKRETVAERAGKFEEANAEVSAAHEARRAAEEKLEELQNQALAAGAERCDCPKCGESLAILQGDESFRLELASEVSAEGPGEALSRAKAELDNAERRVADAEKALKDADAAQEELQEIDKDLEVMHGEEEPPADLSEELQTARQELADLQERQRKAKEAADAEQKAAHHHAEAQAWEKVAAALAADGIPGEILAEALTPINDRLRHSASLTGWPQAHIGGDMTITADGRPFHLLSESEQWRTSAMVADAISHCAGLGLLVLDRMDVLDIPSRSQAMQWFIALAEEYETVLVMGTLKALPQRLPDGVQGVWLENGRITETEEAA